MLARHSVCNHAQWDRLIVVNVESGHGKTCAYRDPVTDGSEDQVGWPQTAGLHNQRVHPGDAGTRAGEDGSAKPGAKAPGVGSGRKASQ